MLRQLAAIVALGSLLGAVMVGLAAAPMGKAASPGDIHLIKHVVVIMHRSSCRQPPLSGQPDRGG